MAVFCGFIAATAGTGGEIVSQNAPGSICPKGWKLPGSNGITKNTFAYMLQQYGLASSDTSGTITGTSGVNGNTYNIALSPLFLVRGGYVYPGDTTTPFRGVGGSGLYWSSRALSSANYAYRLSFNTSVSPSGDTGRYSGSSLRCLIPTP